jgi:hypothetical protein
MACRIKSTPEEQYAAERKRFLAKQKHKPVVAEKLERRNIKQEEKAKKRFNSNDFN